MPADATLPARLRALAPRGGTLPYGEWRRRHAGILALLWCNVLALPVVALAVGGLGAAQAIDSGLGLALVAMLAASPRLSRKLRMSCAALGLMSGATLFIHVFHGVIEAHFYFFVLIVVLTLYEDWLAFGIALLYVLLHHGVIGMIDPHSVFDRPAEWADPWKWAAIHAAFIGAAGAAAVVAWRLNENLRLQMREAQSELERGRRHLADAQDAAGMASWEWNAAGGRTHWSGAAHTLLNLPPASTPTREAMLDALRAQDAHLAREASLRCLRDGIAVDLEYVVPANERGPQRIVHERLSRIESTSGAPTGLLGVIADVTDRVQREHAERSNHAKTEFMSRVSHELRTPLTTILGFGQLLELEPLGERNLVNVRRIVSTGHHLLELIDDVLAIARLDSGSATVSCEPLDVVDIVCAVRDEVVGESAGRGVGLQLRAPVEGLFALANHGHLRQALLNLARNAISCARPGGTVAIAAETVGGQLQISVRDDGPGIAAADLPRLFVPFDGIDVGHDGDPVGTGLGLPVTKALVESMGATLDVMSQLGSGSKFIMRLRSAEPLAQDDDELPQAA